LVRTHAVGPPSPHPHRVQPARALLQGKIQPLLLESRCVHFDEENEVCVVSVRLEARHTVASPTTTVARLSPSAVSCPLR